MFYFDDVCFSMFVGFVFVCWGSIFVFVGGIYEDSKKCYGCYGNSFVVVVLFGKCLCVKVIVMGG